MGATLLYLEENEKDAESFAEALHQTHPKSRLFRFRDKESAQAFLTARHPPELILVGVHSPGTEAKQFIAWVGEQISLSGVPVIVFSGPQVFKTVEEAEGLGAVMFLLKPATPSQWTDLTYQLEDFLRSAEGSAL